MRNQFAFVLAKQVNRGESAHWLRLRRIVKMQNLHFGWVEKGLASVQRSCRFTRNLEVSDLSRRLCEIRTPLFPRSASRKFTLFPK